MQLDSLMGARPPSGASVGCPRRRFCCGSTESRPTNILNCIVDIGICILAGGLSQRMGRDKRRLRLGRRTLLSHVRRAAEAVGLDARVIRKDLVPRCGPLGGIYTALITSTHEAEVFLSCDMPFVTPDLIKRVAGAAGPLFVEDARRVGCPFLLRKKDLEVVQAEMRAGRLSLQNLAKRLNARRLPLRAPEAHQLFNVNTPADWDEAQRRRTELPL